MFRLLLASGFVLSAAVGCAHHERRFERVSFRDGRCGVRCEKVAFRGCPSRCERVAFRGCCPEGVTVARSAPFYDTRYTYDYRTTQPFHYGTSQPTYTQPLPPATYREPMYPPPAPTARGYLTAGQPAGTDQNFVRDAALANIAEIELGRLAVDNAASNEVRDFGRHMIDDHSDALDELHNLAVRMNFDVPNHLDSRHAQTMQRLAGLSGTDFDRQFLDAMIRDHRDVIAKFEARAASQPDNEFKDFANKMLPKLREHLQSAQNLQTKIRG